jgi:N-acetyl sugar amidotransferase
MTATTALTAPIPVPDADPRRERRGATEYRIRYCSRCVMPETRPDILFDADGVCSACRHYDQRPTIDWDARHRELLALLDEYRDTSGTKYDCVVPVSGGKDSTYQVLRVKQLGLNPLCVTATTCLLSDIGRRNIENLKRIGVDYVEVTTNPQVRRRINRLALRQVGDISWPEHASIFTVPVRVAVQYGVRLIVWGENSQNEYGGPASAADDRVLNRRWLEEFGGLIGMRVSDLVGQDGIEARDLIQYTYPSDDDLQRVGVTGIFLGHYLPWDGFANALLAQGHGFESWPSPVEGASSTASTTTSSS